MCNICHWMKPTIEYCHIFTTVEFDIHYYVFVVKGTCAQTLFDLENLIRYHSTMYFIRQLHVQSTILNLKQIDSLPVATIVTTSYFLWSCIRLFFPFHFIIVKVDLIFRIAVSYGEFMLSFLLSCKNVS